MRIQWQATVPLVHQSWRVGSNACCCGQTARTSEYTAIPACWVADCCCNGASGRHASSSAGAAGAETAAKGLLSVRRASVAICAFV